MRKFDKDQILETERLIIKIPDHSFAKSFYDLIDDNVTKFMKWSKLGSIEEYEKRIDRIIANAIKWKRWDGIIVEKESWNMIWKFWIVKYIEDTNCIELWYWLATMHLWKWYITECVEKIKEVWFNNLWYEKILIKAIKENIASINVAKRCWFNFDWILVRDAFVKWEYVDKAYYSFLREEYYK